MSQNIISLNKIIRYNGIGQILLQYKYRSVNFFTYYKFISFLIKF